MASIAATEFGQPAMGTLTSPEYDQLIMGSANASTVLSSRASIFKMVSRASADDSTLPTDLNIMCPDPSPQKSASTSRIFCFISVWPILDGKSWTPDERRYSSTPRE